MGIRTIIILASGGALLASFLVTKINIDEKKLLKQELQSQTALLDRYKQQAELWRTALEEHNARIKEDAEKISAFEERVKDLDAYIENLADRDVACLSDDDIIRLRKLWDSETVKP